MSGSVFNTKSFFEMSDNGKLRLRMDLVPRDDPEWSEGHYSKRPVFSLEEAHTGRVLWTRKGDWRRDITNSLFVSGEGWSILHLGRNDPRLHVITPEGREVLIVGIGHALCSPPERPRHWDGPWEVWADEHVSVTTAGTFWTIDSRIRFAQVGSKSFFICRTCWGRYLVLDLAAARVVSEEESPPELSALLRPADHSWALEILQDVRHNRAEFERAVENRSGAHLSPPAMDELYDNLKIALRIVRQDCVKQAAEHLVELQDISGPMYESPIVAAPKLNYEECHCDQVRKWIHFAMLAVGVKPEGHAMMRFCLAGGAVGAPFLKLPECISGREALLQSLKPGMQIDTVVRCVGAPEAILGDWELQDALPKEDGAQYERWEYDELGADGKPVSWGLMWRLSNLESLQQDSSKPWSHPCRLKTADECLSVLVSVTRLEWTDAYREMREGD